MTDHMYCNCSGLEHVWPCPYLELIAPVEERERERIERKRREDKKAKRP